MHFIQTVLIPKYWPIKAMSLILVNGPSTLPCLMGAVFGNK